MTSASASALSSLLPAAAPALRTTIDFSLSPSLSPQPRSRHPFFHRQHFAVNRRQKFWILAPSATRRTTICVSKTRHPCMKLCCMHQHQRATCSCSWSDGCWKVSCLAYRHFLATTFSLQHSWARNVYNKFSLAICIYTFWGLKNDGCCAVS